MEELLRTQQTEAAARRTELEQSLAGCRGQLHSQSREADQLRQQLSLAQKVRDEGNPRCVLRGGSFSREQRICRGRWCSTRQYGGIPQL